MRRSASQCVGLLSAVAMLLSTTGSPCAEPASFLGDGTYTLPGGCTKLARTAKGGATNINTVPETLTAKGFAGWEHGCAFDRIAEKTPGKVWVAEVGCSEGPDEWKETNTFEKMDARTYRVTVNGKTDVYRRCDVKVAPKK